MLHIAGVWEGSLEQRTHVVRSEGGCKLVKKGEGECVEYSRWRKKQHIQNYKCVQVWIWRSLMWLLHRWERVSWLRLRQGGRDVQKSLKGIVKKFDLSPEGYRELTKAVQPDETAWDFWEVTLASGESLCSSWISYKGICRLNVGSGFQALCFYFSVYKTAFSHFIPSQSQLFLDAS